MGFVQETKGKVSLDRWCLKECSETLWWKVFGRLKVSMLCAQQIKTGYGWISCLIARLLRSKVRGQRAWSSHQAAFAQSCAPACLHGVALLLRRWHAGGGKVPVNSVTEQLWGAVAISPRCNEPLSWWAGRWLCAECIEQPCCVREGLWKVPPFSNRWWLSLKYTGHVNTLNQTHRSFATWSFLFVVTFSQCCVAGTPALLYQFCGWYHEQCGLVARDQWGDFIL